MKLTILGSGSSGNGYVLHNDQEAIVLEAGMPVQDCLKALSYNVRNIQACFITHEHGDHARHVKKYAQYMPVWMSEGTKNALYTEEEEKYMQMPLITAAFATIGCGGFKVRAIPAKHDAAEPLAYIIEHKEIGRMLFATDTYCIEYEIPGLTNIMIECNYDIDILNKNVKAGIINEELKKRTMDSHMSIRNLKKMLKANDIKKVSQIILLHLSDRNSDEFAFCKEIEAATGKLTTVARKGLTIEINKQPF